MEKVGRWRTTHSQKGIPISIPKNPRTSTQELGQLYPGIASSSFPGKSQYNLSKSKVPQTPYGHMGRDADRNNVDLLVRTEIRKCPPEITLEKEKSHSAHRQDRWTLNGRPVNQENLDFIQKLYCKGTFPLSPLTPGTQLNYPDKSIHIYRLKPEPNQDNDILIVDSRPSSSEQNIEKRLTTPRLNNLINDSKEKEPDKSNTRDGFTAGVVTVAKSILKSVAETINPFKQEPEPIQPQEPRSLYLSTASKKISPQLVLYMEESNVKVVRHRIKEVSITADRIVSIKENEQNHELIQAPFVHKVHSYFSDGHYILCVSYNAALPRGQSGESNTRIFVCYEGSNPAYTAVDKFIQEVYKHVYKDISHAGLLKSSIRKKVFANIKNNDKKRKSTGGESRSTEDDVYNEKVVGEVEMVQGKRIEKRIENSSSSSRTPSPDPSHVPVLRALVQTSSDSYIEKEYTKLEFCKPLKKITATGEETGVQFFTLDSPTIMLFGGQVLTGYAYTILRSSESLFYGFIHPITAGTSFHESVKTVCDVLEGYPNDQLQLKLQNLAWEQFKHVPQVPRRNFYPETDQSEKNTRIENMKMREGSARRNKKTEKIHDDINLFLRTRNETRKSKQFLHEAGIGVVDLTEFKNPSPRKTKTKPKYPSSGIMFIYPPEETSSLSIGWVDFAHLEPQQFLNDVILEFYLKYIWKNLSDPIVKNETYIFSSFFYSQLTRKTTDTTRDDKQRFVMSYENVRKWTKNVDIFEKKYLIVPINEHLHWYLAIVWNPGALIREEVDVPDVIVESSQDVDMFEDMMVLEKSVENVEDVKIPATSDVVEEVSEITSSQEVVPESPIQESMDKKQKIVNYDDSTDSENFVTVTSRSGIKKAEDDMKNVVRGKKVISIKNSSERSDEENKKALEQRRERFRLEENMMKNKKRKEAEKKRKYDEGRFLANTVKSQSECKIFIFDSLGHMRPKAVSVIGDYLKISAKENHGKDVNVKIAGGYAKVPGQNNFYDCGIFLLQYVETFLKNTEALLPLLFNGFQQDEAWFSQETIGKKRGEIQSLMLEYHAEYKKSLPSQEPPEEDDVEESEDDVMIID